MLQADDDKHVIISFFFIIKNGHVKVKDQQLSVMCSI